MNRPYDIRPLFARAPLAARRAVVRTAAPLLARRCPGSRAFLGL